MDPADKITAASAMGNADVVNALLQQGIDANITNRFGRTPLQVMMMGSAPVAELLLRHGANPNVRDTTTGATPLHDAARTGFLDTVTVLVRYNADIHARDNQNMTPADIAMANNCLDVVAFLSDL